MQFNLMNLTIDKSPAEIQLLAKQAKLKNVSA